MSTPSPSSDSEYIPQSSKIPLQELIPYCACICFVTSCYTDFPDCIGCSGKRVCLCCYSEFISCKFPKETEENIWCHFDKGHTYCGPVETCCMQRSQLFCLDVQCSLPLMEEIPVLVTCCFFTFYYKDECGPFECFKTVKELDDIIATPAAVMPPAFTATGAGSAGQSCRQVPTQVPGTRNTTNVAPSATSTACTQTDTNTQSKDAETTTVISSPLTSTIQNT